MMKQLWYVVLRVKVPRRLGMISQHRVATVEEGETLAKSVSTKSDASLSLT